MDQIVHQISVYIWCMYIIHMYICMYVYLCMVSFDFWSEPGMCLCACMCMYVRTCNYYNVFIALAIVITIQNTNAKTMKATVRNNYYTSYCNVM